VNYIRPCPSCGVELRIPLNRGILSVKCPTCEFRFQFDPSDPLIHQIGYLEKNQKFKLPILFSNQTLLKKIVPIILFFILSLYIIKDCGFISKTRNSLPSIQIESDPSSPLFMDQENEPNLKQDDEIPEIKKSYESPGTSI
jgi:hypothetical protein